MFDQVEDLALFRFIPANTTTCVLVQVSFVPRHYPAQQAFFPGTARTPRLVRGAGGRCQHAVLQRQLSHHRLELLVLAAQRVNFVAVGFPFSIANQSLLARFQKFLAPLILHVQVDTFAAAKFDDLFFSP